MGKNLNNSTLNEHARNFLDCSARGVSDEDLNEALKPLIPFINKIINNVYKGWSSRPPCEKEDLEQETYKRLVRKPPTGTASTQRPIKTLGKWVKKTSENILKDLYKYYQRRPTTSYDINWVADCNENRPDKIVERRINLDRFSKWKERESPPVYRYFRAWLENPGLHTHEIAQLLEIRTDNVNQRRSRLMKNIEIYRNLVEREDR